MPVTEDILEKRMLLVEQSIDLHGGYLFHLLHQWTNNRHDAEDLLNDLWALVLRAFPERKIGQFGLLRRKAYQIFIDHQRRKKNNPVTAMESLPEAPAAPITEPYNDRDEAQFKERFFAEYSVELDPEKREAVWLYARYGLTYEEIATRFDKSANTIGDWIRQARELFSNAIETN